MAAVYDDHGEDVDNSGTLAKPQTGGWFTPVKSLSEPDKFRGVVVKQFPKETDPGDIMEFLTKSGLPEIHKSLCLSRPMVQL